jgi:hypothetical protein
MSTRYKCPGCGSLLSVPESDAGRGARCPRCATRHSIPGQPVGAVNPYADDIIPTLESLSGEQPTPEGSPQGQPDPLGHGGGYGPVLRTSGGSWLSDARIRKFSIGAIIAVVAVAVLVVGVRYAINQYRARQIFKEQQAQLRQRVADASGGDSQNTSAGKAQRSRRQQTPNPRPGDEGQSGNETTVDAPTPRPDKAPDDEGPQRQQDPPRQVEPDHDQQLDGDYAIRPAPERTEKDPAAEDPNFLAKAYLDQLGRHLTLYAQRNGGRFPEKLVEQLRVSTGLTLRMRIKGPASGSAGYEYVEGLTLSSPPESILAWDPSPIDNDRILVLRVDGSVDAVESLDALEEALAEQSGEDESDSSGIAGTGNPRDGGRVIDPTVQQHRLMGQSRLRMNRVLGLLRQRKAGFGSLPPTLETLIKETWLDEKDREVLMSVGEPERMYDYYPDATTRTEPQEVLLADPADYGGMRVVMMSNGGTRVVSSDDLGKLLKRSASSEPSQ